MGMYTTGEIAKLVGVSVRTVQYYDNRGILYPSKISEGGRRLYTEEDLSKLRIICFLRNADIPINSIQKLLSEDNPGNVISVLIEQQKEEIQSEIKNCERKLEILQALCNSLKTFDNFSMESIGDVANLMKNKTKLKKVRTRIFSIGIIIELVEVSSILYWIIKGCCIPFLIFLFLAIPTIIICINYYYKNISYICPHCHKVFKPKMKEVILSRHTPTTRKLSCTCCGHKGYCIETGN